MRLKRGNEGGGQREREKGGFKRQCSMWLLTELLVSLSKLGPNKQFSKATSKSSSVSRRSLDQVSCLNSMLGFQSRRGSRSVLSNLLVS